MFREGFRRKIQLSAFILCYTIRHERKNMQAINNNKQHARSEFSAALNQVCAERGIKPEAVLESIQAALLAAYRKDADKTEEEIVDFKATVDPVTGAANILDDKGKDITPAGFGRIAAQAAKQIILQRNREAEKDAIISDFQNKIGTIINGMVLRFEGKIAVIDLGRAQTWLPPEEQSPEEYYRLNQRLTVYVKEIRDTPRGPRIIVSRNDPRLVNALFAREVPEIANGAVIIKNVARDPGKRTKIAVDSTEEGVDPVGSCVGQKGVRVQAVTNQLNGEKIDIIPFNKDLREFIKASLSPADGLIITLDEKNKRAKVIAAEDQQAIAIGRGGQNVRLASALTGWEIDIVGADKIPLTETAETKTVKTTKKETKTKKPDIKPDK